jgi:hypothetical protein
MASKIKVDQIQTADGSGTIALQNQLSGMTSASMPTGSVLQVVTWRSTTHNTTTTSQSFVDAGIAATIAPSSTSSKVLVMVSINGLHKDGVNDSAATKLLRGSTDLTQIDGVMIHDGTTAASGGSTSISYLDSPNTNSNVTYKIQFRSAGGGTVFVNTRYNSSMTSHSTITLIEIAG